MPTNYKILGQTAPSAGSETLNYTVPSSKSTLVRSINITNTSATADTYNIAILPSVIPTTNPTFFAAAGPNNETHAAYSTDAITWTRTTLPSQQSWYSAAYGNGTFIIVAWGADANAAASSTNGITWTLRTMPSASGWYNAAYGNNIFVAVSYNEGKAASSTDGITWTARTMPFIQGYRGLAYGGNTFVAVGTGSNSVNAAYSTNGTTWASSEMPENRRWLGVAYGNNTFVSVAYQPSGNPVATSTNGITWTLRANALFGSFLSWRPMTFGNGIFLASSGGPVAATSTDGITWTQITMPDVGWRTLTFGNGRFSAIAAGTAQAAYSTNGISWTLTTMPQSAFWTAAAYGDEESPIPSQNNNYIAFNASVPGNSTVSIKAGYTLETGNGIRVTSTNGTSTFSAFGAEIS
jgi:hypothetical protein